MSTKKKIQSLIEEKLTNGDTHTSTSTDIGDRLKLFFRMNNKRQRLICHHWKLFQSISHHLIISYVEERSEHIQQEKNVKKEWINQ